MSTTAIILAAGKGTRMNSDLAKVLHEVSGRPMVCYVLDACRGAGCDRAIVVVGHQADRVREALASANAEVDFALQQPQFGTGHAVMICRDHLEELSGPVLVLAGDGPLIRAQTLRTLLDEHTACGADCTLATSILDDPGHYGRVIRDQDGTLSHIVEWAHASDEQRAVREVNVSLYCFDAAALRDALVSLEPHVFERNGQRKEEYYLTDTLEIIRRRGGKLAAVAAVEPEETISVNTREQLAEVQEIMDRRGEVG